MYQVLLVEDEDILRKGIRNSVPWERYGCSVAGEAANGREGVEQICALHPDIVITDINMPLMDGLQMIAQTKGDYDYAAVILTGYSDFEYAQEAIRSGVADYVLKPLNTGTMCEALERAVLECRNVRWLRARNERLEALRDVSLLPENPPDVRRDEVAAQVLRYLEENYRERVTLADLVDALHYSDRYINQRFQKATGTTVIEYLNRLRIQKALSLLGQGAVPISEVGTACGIGDYKYFTQVFRKYMGCSPREYQQKLR